MRIVHAALLALILAPGAARADQVISTAPAAQSPPAAAPVPPLRVTDADARDAPEVRMGPCGPETVDDSGKAATKAHGFVEAGVGTSGYRHLAAGVCKPLANGGAVAVSVSESQAQGQRYGR